MILPILLLALLQLTWCFVAYDCGGTGLNVTTISLMDVGECDIEPRRTNETEVYLQLLQLSNFEYTDILQCKVEITRTIFHCGMHSHISAVQNGYNEYLHETSYQACRRLHEDGSLSLGSHLYLTGFKPNSTATRPVTFAGYISPDGSCSGTSYSDPYGSWNGVVVQGAVRVSLKTGTARIKLNSEKIILPSGCTCNTRYGSCIDDENGHTFWLPTPTKSCRFNHYDVLYEGMATRVTDASDDISPVVYTLTAKDITFALTKTGETNLCGYTLYRTEHPKLFVMETKKGKTFASIKNVPVDNLDIFTYVNSKFVYVERHIRTQLNGLYADVLKQRCRLERQVLKNALATTKTSPEEFAYTLMKGPGYVAVVAGEVAHILRCVPVNVKVRHTEHCHNELPVFKGNQSLFITPKTRILTKIGTVRDCDTLLPVMYNIDGAWHRFTPHPVESLTPQTLQPMSKPTWKYLIPASLATSGIYSEADIERLRDHIMFPAEKQAILNTIVRGVTGQEFVHGGLSMYNLLDEASLNKIVDSTVSQVWDGFISFGSASAGILAIFLVLRLIKIMFDTIIRGYALHSVYGWSLHLLGAVWSSIAHLLLHLAGRKKNPTDPAHDNEEELPAKPPAACAPAVIYAESSFPADARVSTATLWRPASTSDLQAPLRRPREAPPRLPADPPATLRRPRHTPPDPATASTAAPRIHYSYEELRDRISRIDQNLPHF